MVSDETDPEHNPGFARHPDVGTDEERR